MGGHAGPLAEEIRRVSPPVAEERRKQRPVQGSDVAEAPVFRLLRRRFIVYSHCWPIGKQKSFPLTHWSVNWYL